MTGPRISSHAMCAVAAALALGATAGACTAADSQVTIPDTPVAEAFRTWLAAYNAADSATLDAYVRRYEPTMSVHTQLVFRQQTGPYELLTVERSEPRHLEVQLRTHSDSSVDAHGDLTVYAGVDLAVGPPQRAKTTLALVAKGVPATALAGLARKSAHQLPSIDRARRVAAIESLAVKIDRNYVRADVGRRIADSLRARLARDTYDAFHNEPALALRLDADLQSLSHDPQLGVEYAFNVPLTSVTPVPPALLHCGIASSSVSDDGVAVLTFYSFESFQPTCAVETGKPLLTEAWDMVGSARAIIIDLRDNAGESRDAMAYIASHLLAGCVHLGDVWTRHTGKTDSLYTHAGLPGVSFGGIKPLVMLTSMRTSAAAEELAYLLQALGRATIIGERTSGSANVTAMGRLSEHILFRVPVAAVVNPVTKTNWQDSGVKPDFEVAASDASVVARRLLRDGRIPRGRDIPLAARPPATPPSDREAHVSATVPGIRLVIDTTVPPDAPYAGALRRESGVIEFANGRGRFDVTSVRHMPVLSIDGVTVDEPLARPGDYYLFDNSGFIVVHPASRTYSSFSFTRADYNHTGALLPGAFMFNPRQAKLDTLHSADGMVLRQHAPISLHFHMQPPNFSGNGRLYARGWLEVADAPAIVAGIARWFEVAAAVATSGDQDAIVRGGLAVTSVAQLRRPGERRDAVNYTEELRPAKVSSASIETSRLLLPAGYAQVPWPGSERRAARDQRVSSASWLTLEDQRTQRARAVCSQPWF